MASLNEFAEWVAGIYRIEETDPVLGGEPNESTGAGLDNIPHLQLAKRTAWLREALLAAGLTAENGKLVTSLNSITTAGFFHAAAGAAGSPDETAPVIVLHIPGATSAVAYQIAMRVGTATRIWLRRRNSAAWAAWLEMLNTSNTGNAAQATLQAGATDGTAGRVLTVGAFGIGGNAPRITDLNALTDTGIYEILDDATGAPPQTPSTWANGALIHIRGAAGQKTQIASMNGDGSLGFLQMRIDDGTGAGFSPWRVFFNNGSTIPIENGGTGASTAAGARAALIATSTLGSVGTHAFLRRSTANQPIEKGATYSGSSLRYAGVIDSNADYKAQLELSDNSAPSGTWMALGSVGNISSHYSATMFLRIA